MTVTDLAAATAAYESLMGAIEKLDGAEKSLRLCCSSGTPADTVAGITPMVKSATVALIDEINKAARRTAQSRTGPVLASWDRGRVLEQIAEASGQDLSVIDSLPDSLIATAQSLGMAPHELQNWIYDGRKDWTQAALATWARRYGFARNETEGPRAA